MPQGIPVVREGQKAPDFSLPSSGGGVVRLSNLRGDAAGVVRRVFPKVKVDGHAEEVQAVRATL